MFTAISLATLFLVIATVLPLWRNPHWSVRGMDFPRIQFSVLAVLLLLAQFSLLDLQQSISWLLISVTFVSFIWQASWIIRYTPFWPKEVKKANHYSKANGLSIITANVLTPNKNADKLIALVKQKQPDVLVTLESDQWWQEQLDTLQTDMPHTIKCPLDNLYGMHVYSRLPLEETQIEYLVEDDVPSMHALMTLRNGEKVRIHFLHPAPPSPTENPESAERDAELVIVGRSIADTDFPTIVTGDLNDVAWSTTTRLFQKLSGLLDPRVGRGFFNTFHAGYAFIRWPLDHIFHSEHFTFHSMQRLPSIGSDHFAIYTELAFTPKHGADQEGLDADHDDHDWADEIVDKQNVSKEDVPVPEAKFTQASS